MSAVAPPMSPPVVQGPLAKYLSNPGGATHQLLTHLRHLVDPLDLELAAGAVGVVGCIALAFLAVRRNFAKKTAQGARQIRVLIPPEVVPVNAEVFWTKVVALLRPSWRRVLGQQAHVGFEMTATASGLEISLWVPRSVPPGFIEGAVQSAWPGALTEIFDPVPPLDIGSACEGGSLVLAGPEWFPLRTEFHSDPLRLILTTLGAVGEDQKACVQVLARPVTGRRLSRVHKAASFRRCGRPITRAARLVDLVAPGTTLRPAETDPTRASDVAQMLSKVAGPCFAIQIRYGISTSAPGSRAGVGLKGQAHDIASSYAIFSGRNHLDRKRLPHCDVHLASRSMGKGQLVSVTELGALAHLPTDTDVAGLSRAGAKAVAPPPQVATFGKVIGVSEVGSQRPVALAVPDARYHLHVMGATGSGKSTLLTNLILGDIEDKRGVIVIDPKGDLVNDVLDCMPPGAAPPVIIDPDDCDAPPVMNVLDGGEAEHDLIVDNLVGIFRSIFEAYWGPRTDDVLRASCLTLLRHASTTKTTATLSDVPTMLTNDRFRAARVRAIQTNSSLKGFWDTYEAMGEGQRTQVIGPVMNKLRAFLLRDFVASLMGPTPSSFSMDDVLNGGVCFVRIPKGILGEDTTRLLGSFVLAKVWQAATHRARLGQDARVDAALYVDECQNFLTLPRSFDEMLAEARGYRLSMTLAHQHLAQLPRDLREAVSANARSKVFFSLSPEDAHSLSRHVAPNLTEHDLAHLGAYQVAARLVVDGAETPAFTLRTRAAVCVQDGRASIIRSSSQDRYGRDATQREKKAIENDPQIGGYVPPRDHAAD